MKLRLKTLLHVLSLHAVLSPAIILAENPSFNCKKVESGSIESVVCGDKELIDLDLKLDKVYRDASIVDAKMPESILKAEQRGWVKGRNDCWKSDNRRSCIKDSYQRRIAELQVRYRLLQPISSNRYFCENNRANEVVLHSFATKPAALSAERGDSTYTLYRDESEVGKFVGRNEIIVLQGDSLKASFSYGDPLINCQLGEKVPQRMHPSWDVNNDGINDCEKDDSCDHTSDYSKPRSQ